ncbi:hypothetical protein LTR04_001400 [Oleoguttula sp. CCFEE 6159]|nr:hypothetical protein LTR04_001400 [Oleoguttula sp. CCFEE 6159]
MFLGTYIAIGVALVGFTVLSLINARRQKKAPVGDLEFPGPALIPWVGRIHDLPIDYMWLKFKEWADIYGPIYKTRMLGATFIVISDEKMAEELLVKRAKIYSDRPQIRSLFDSKSTHGSMEYLPLMGRNQYWARQRKFSHAYLIEAANSQYHGIMHHEVKRFLNRLLENPDDFCFSLEDMASKIMCTLTWDNPDYSVYCAKSAWGLLTQMSPAGPITNILTPLWHLPLFMNPWKKAEHKRHDEQQAWWMERLMTVKADMAQGKARFCWTRQFLETEKTNLSGDYEASSVIGMLALVGIFTIGGPLHYFLMAMVFHPEWQKKLQQEIDTACSGEMPTFSDSPKLPILRACIKETMRWKPNVPTGVAHEVEADDFYKGYFIPKGTRILPLDWAFLRNAVKYPDPENFRPERWLEPGWPTYQEPLTVYPNVKGMSSFGHGQRQCLGQTLTQDELLIACGALAWAFNMKKKVDPVTKQEIDIDLNKSNSLLIVKPDNFEMAFEPRSEKKKAEIAEQWRVADAKDQAERKAFLEAARAKQEKS